MITSLLFFATLNYNFRLPFLLLIGQPVSHSGDNLLIDFTQIIFVELTLTNNNYGRWRHSIYYLLFTRLFFNWYPIYDFTIDSISLRMSKSRLLELSAKVRNLLKHLFNPKFNLMRCLFFNSWRWLPPAPDYTGLNPVVPPITIPAGSFGSYVCNDTTLGVESGGTPFFQVELQL